MSDRSTSMPSIEPGSLRAWLLGIRPKTLPAATAPVLLGTAIASRLGGLHWGAALAALVGALLLQITSNLANDVFDYEKGKDTAERLGPTRVVQAGLLTPAQVRRGLVAVLLGCLLVGSYLVGKTGWPLVVVGLAAMLAALAYTAGPYPLGYHGLGDVFVFLFFGPVAVAGTTFAQCEWLAPDALIASIAMGTLTGNILVVNNLRDRTEDAKTGKRTLAVRFGKHFAMRHALTNLVLAYLVPLYFCWQSRRPWPLLLPLLAVPWAVRWYRALGNTEGRAMNPLLAEAGKLLLVFSVLFSTGLLLSP